MMYAIENQMVSGFAAHPILPSAVCQSCQQPIYDTITATAKEQMSASGVYCEDCIEKLDTPDNRLKWLDERSLYAKFLEWYFSGENERDFLPDAKATAKTFCDMWRQAKKPKHWAEEFDSQLKEYISCENSYAYTQWLLDTN